MLASAIEMLSTDQRFVAAWLSGSFGRGEVDNLSDVDITVVVADGFAERLCCRPYQVSAETTPERLEILQSIGEPAIVLENHYNAPAGGAFTACVYASGVTVDWTFVPALNAVRSADTRLLFDTAGIPAAPPPAAITDAERTQRLSEQAAFFWMMIVPMSKARLRGDFVAFQQMLEMLYGVIADVERLLAREPWRYTRHSRAPFAATAAGQQEAVRAICERMNALGPLIVAAGATVPDAPWDAVRPWVEELPSTS
jgi:hypothetical protein